MRSSDPVRAFYERAPFPGVPPREDLSALRARAARSEFVRLLDRAIPPDARVLEIGCGTGQLSVFLASGGRAVTGADFSLPSLRLARETAARCGVSVAFVASDLRAPALSAGSFDVVICSGVLHHTADPRRSFSLIAPLARPGGVVVAGVYNAFARLPLRLRRLLARLTRFRWIPGDPILRDRRDARREAWLRDQYQHPEEHVHTLREVQGWFCENGIDWLRAFPSAVLGEEPGDLFAQAEDDWGLEAVLAQIGWMRSLGGEGGLFVAVGRRRD